MTSGPTPENGLVLRQVAGMRRDLIEIMEREARVVELLGRMNGRLDELTGRTGRQFAEIRGDLVLMENRILTAIREVRPMAARLEETADPEPA